MAEPERDEKRTSLLEALPGSQARMRRLRFFWIPLALIIADAILVVLAVLLALIVLPIVLILLMLAAFGRWLIRFVTRGRVFPRKAEATDSDAGDAAPPKLDAETRRQLAERYHPAIVAFPEDREQGPPYRTGEIGGLGGADYHPRPVEIFLEHVHLRRGRTQWLPDLPGTTDPEVLRRSLGDRHERASSLEIPWLHGGNPVRILRHLFPFGRQFRAHWAIPVPRADCGCSTTVWHRYMDIIDRDTERGPGNERYPRTIYARVLEGRELPEIGEGHPLSGAVAVQYWWFLFYNDAWNRHQADWEGVTVFLVAGEDGFQPLGTAYDGHDLGRWRRWQDVQRLDETGAPATGGTHPIVHMARGSHASYFDHNESGYHPSMSRMFRIPFFGDFRIPSQVVLENRNAVDWVADVNSGLGNGVTLANPAVRLMPAEHVLRDLETLREDDEWWWLAYRGLWGSPEALPFFGGSGPRGPRYQGVKWSNPFAWVMRECIADDVPYWLETFATWELGEESDWLSEIEQEAEAAASPSAGS